VPLLQEHSCGLLSHGWELRTEVVRVVNYYEKYHTARNLPFSLSDAGVCEYRPEGVNCTNRTKCFKCGWNPRVEAVRKAKNRERMKEEMND